MINGPFWQLDRPNLHACLHVALSTPCLERLGGERLQAAAAVGRDELQATAQGEVRFLAA
jgi:hypothetical protein